MVINTGSDPCANKQPENARMATKVITNGFIIV
jgi:hypothetical protein